MKFAPPPLGFMILGLVFLALGLVIGIYWFVQGYVGVTAAGVGVLLGNIEAVARCREV